MDQITDILQRLKEFRDERDWSQFHTFKDLATALSIEASELLELTLWEQPHVIDNKLKDAAYRARVEEECADIFNYLILLADKAEIDLVAAAKRKIEHNSAKYPVNKAKGKSTKYDQL